MIRTIICDLGKVVLWFDNGIFLNRLAARGGIDPAAARAAAHENLDLVRRFDGGTMMPREFYETVSRAVGVLIPEDDFFLIYNDIFWPNSPVVELLKKVKAAGYRMVLLSNTDPVRFGFIRTRFPEVGIFDEFVLSYEVKLLKPDPAIYLEAARRGRAEPAECVFIDDLAENVAGAAAAGLRAIHYTPETDLGAELRKAGVTF